MVISNAHIVSLVLDFMGHYGCNRIWCTDKAAFTILDIEDKPIVRWVRRAQYVYSGHVTASKAILEQVSRINAAHGYNSKPNEIGHRVGDKVQVTYDLASRDNIWSRRQHKSSHFKMKFGYVVHTKSISLKL